MSLAHSSSYVLFRRHATDFSRFEICPRHDFLKYGRRAVEVTMKITLDDPPVHKFVKCCLLWFQVDNQRYQVLFVLVSAKVWTRVVKFLARRNEAMNITMRLHILSADTVDTFSVWRHLWKGKPSSGEDVFLVAVCRFIF